MRDPTKINLPTDLLYYSGQCGSPATLSDIAQSFIETIEKSVHSDICKINEDCTVDNVVITCGWPTRRRRKRALVGRRLRHNATESPVEDIEKTTDDIKERLFEGLQEMRISMKLGVGVSKVIDVKVAQKKLQDLAREVLDITVSEDSGRFSSFMEPHAESGDAPDAYLLISEHYIDCPDGYVAGRNNTKCGKFTNSRLRRYNRSHILDITAP